MQEVYENGQGGVIKHLTESGIIKSLEKPNVDHVEIFQEGSEAHLRAVERIFDVDARAKERWKFRKIIEKK